MKKLINIYHRLISAFILIYYKDFDKAKNKSFEYYNKHIKLSKK